MRYRMTFVVAGLLVVSTVVASAKEEARPANSAEALRPTLTEIIETRKLVVAEKDGDKFVFPNEKPGLALKFDVEAPEGLTFVEMGQPARIVAFDSTNGDLTKIEKNFMDRLEYVKMEQSFGDAPKGFTLTLAPPARGATAFNLAFVFDAVVFEKTVEEEMAAPSDWTTLPSHLAGDEEVKIRVDGDEDDLNVFVRPGTAKRLFESVSVTGSRGESESVGTMWSDSEARFMFSGAFEEGMTLKLRVRTGLKTVPVAARLEKQKLP